MRIHPGDPDLRDAFGAKDLPPARRRELLDHLRACGRCRERLREINSPASLLSRKVAERLPRLAVPRSDRDYDAVLDRSLARSLAQEDSIARERAEAPRLMERLLDQPPERRDLLLRNHAHYQTWSLAELILDRSAIEALQDSRPSEDLARLALRVVGYLDPRRYGRERLEDLKAKTWSRIGNALRIRSELTAADAAFAKGFAHLRRGTGDSLEKAICLDLKTSLLRAQRRLDEAERLQERAIVGFLALGETHLAGRALLNLGATISFAGDPELGISIQYDGAELIDETRDPDLLFFALHNLVDDLSLAGRAMEAQALFQRALPYYDRFPSQAVQSRRQWVEGRIALQLGRYTSAKILLRNAYDGFHRSGRLQEAQQVAESLKGLAGDPKGT
jgi:tetratricopeptide (TPR) repeat protein